MKTHDAGASRWLLFVLLLAPATALAQTPWARATADKLMRFLPSPVTGLTTTLPWDTKDYNKPRVVEGLAGWGREEIPYDPPYAPVGVEQHWRYTDAALVQKVQAAEKQAKAQLEAHMKMGEQGPSAEQEARERRASELGEKAAQLAEQGKLAEMKKVLEEQQRLMAPVTRGQKELITSKDEPGRLKQSARALRMWIQANLHPRSVDDPRPAGTMKGHPLERAQWSDKTHMVVHLRVRFGPGCEHRPELGMKLREALQCLYVVAETHSNAASVAADEAIARKMLEKVDYAGLAKLLKS